jgi:hypothetical protein
MTDVHTAGIDIGFVREGFLGRIAHQVGVATGTVEMYEIRANIDGESHHFPMTGRHFVACPPGEHEVVLSVGDKVLGPMSVRAMLTKTELRVQVLAGEVTEVTITMGTFGSVAVGVTHRPM